MAEPNLSAKYLYYSQSSPVQWGSASKLKSYIRKNSSSKKEAEKYIRTVEDLEKEINLGTHSFSKLKRIGTYHYHISPYSNTYYQADLLDVVGSMKKDRKYRKANKNYVWLLLVINSQTKKLYFRAQKTKSGSETSNSLESIFKDDLKLTENNSDDINLQVDDGKEFFNLNSQQIYKKYNINVYSSSSIHKSCIIERANREIRSYLTKAMEVKGENWVSLIPSIIKNYNNSYHRSISMTPNEAERNFTKCLFLTEENREKRQTKRDKFVKFKKGDIVRVRVHFPNARQKFHKGTHRNFSAEVFRIKSVQNRINNHTTYKLEDLDKNVKAGTYNNNDLIPGKEQIDYPVIILEKRIKNKIKQALIAFDGFPDYPSKWINESELVNL